MPFHICDRSDKNNMYMHQPRKMLHLISMYAKNQYILGTDNQSLLCSESMLSSDPHSDDALRLQQHNAQLWKYTDSSASSVPHHQPHNEKAAKFTSLVRGNSRESLLSKEKLINNKLVLESRAATESATAGGVVKSVVSSSSSSSSLSSSSRERRGSSSSGQGHGEAPDRRMSTNGLDRPTMTGSSTTTSETIPWLASVAISQSAAPQQRVPVQGILTPSGLAPPGGGVGGGAGEPPHQHEAPHASAMLPAVPGGASSLFRPPLSISDPRLHPSGQYAPIYTTTGSSLPPYSPTIYSPHTQPSQLASALSHYSAFYPQYPPGYSAGVMTGHYPGTPMESYAAVLANMSSQVQQHLPPPPRTPYISSGQIPQYLSSHGTLTPPTNSPGPSIQQHRPLTPGQPPHTPSSLTHIDPSQHRNPREEKSPKSDPRDLERRVLVRGSPSKELRTHPSPALHSQAKHASHKEAPPEAPGRDPGTGYKVPSGKEGSLKHRILTRPPDIQIGPLGANPDKHGQLVKSEEPSPKRQKSVGGPPPLQPARPPSKPNTPDLPPPPPLQSTVYPTQPHYPPHFMKGSIIQLANGELKRVEDLRTDDFVQSADISGDLKIDSSTVVRIEMNPDRNTALLGFSVGEHRVQVTVEATLEHPFFVFGRGWSSCHPERTIHRYGLTCHKLSVGDVCISLTHKEASTRAAEISQQRGGGGGSGSSSGGGGGSMQPPLTPAESSSSSSSSSRTNNNGKSRGGGGEKEKVKGDKGQGQGQSVLPQMQSAETQTRDVKYTSQVSHQVASSSDAASAAQGQGQSTRKRRWSAPDQISIDSPTNRQDGSSDIVSPSATGVAGTGDKGNQT